MVGFDEGTDSGQACFIFMQQLSSQANCGPQGLPASRAIRVTRTHRDRATVTRASDSVVTH